MLYSSKIVGVLVLALGLAACSAIKPPTTRFEGRRILQQAVATSDSVLQAAVDDEFIPGAVLLVGLNGQIVHLKAFGYAELFEEDDNGQVSRLARPIPMTTDDVFDLASLTKVFATTFGMMLLVDRGKVDLDAPVYTYLPSFRGTSKDSVTVRHLLTHSAGLYQWKPLYYHADNSKDVLAYISQLELAYPVGRERHYSDLGFMLLGYIIEHVSGRPLNEYLSEELYEPLGLKTTGYLPRLRGLIDFAATSHGNPFEYKMVADSTFGYKCDENVDDFKRWRHYTLVGEVNDGNSYYANRGVAGHAGLFSDAADLNVLLNLLLDKGTNNGKRYISEAVIDQFLTRDRFDNGLGWAKSSRVLRADNLTEGAFGHTGFTGTYAVAIPEYGLTIILLTNRQNLGVDESGRYHNVTPLRKKVTELMIAALASSS